jgi:hypothetical protein
VDGAAVLHGWPNARNRRASVSPAALKRAGGKRWQVPHLRPLWEAHPRSRLVEPFCGGLAVTLGLLPERAVLALFPHEPVEPWGPKASAPRYLPPLQLVPDGIAGVNCGRCFEPGMAGGCHPAQKVKHRDAIRYGWFTEHLNGMLQLVPD